MNTHTKQQQDKVFETDFIDSQKSYPSFAHLLALSHYIYMCVCVYIYIYTYIHTHTYFMAKWLKPSEFSFGANLTEQK